MRPSRRLSRPCAWECVSAYEQVFCDLICILKRSLSMLDLTAWLTGSSRLSRRINIEYQPVAIRRSGLIMSCPAVREPDLDSICRMNTESTADSLPRVAAGAVMFSCSRTAPVCGRAESRITARNEN